MTHKERSSFWVLVVAFVFLIRATMAQVNSTDLFWHLKLGEDMLHGLLPNVDRYSFSMLGAPIRGIPWIFEILVATFYKLGGAAGIQLFRGACWCLAVGILFLLFRERKFTLAQVTFGLLVAVSGLTLFYEPRPDLVNNVFMSVCLLFFFRARERLNSKLVLQMAVLLWLWSIYHATAVIGFIVVGSLYVDRLLAGLLEGIPRRDLAKVAGWGGLTFAVGFFTPGFQHPVIRVLHGSLNWQGLITDYESTDYFSLAFHYQLILIMVALSIFYFLYKKKWAETIILAVMLWETWQVKKIGGYLVFLAAPLVAEMMGGIATMFPKRARNDARRFLPRAAYSCVAGVVFVGLVISVWILPYLPIKASLTPSYYPVDVVQELKKQNAEGNAVTEFELGGYVLHELGPRVKVYLDTRTQVLYPQDFFVRAMTTIHDPALFRNEAQKSDVKYVIGFLPVADSIVLTALRTGLFSLDYVGEANALLVRGTAGRFAEVARELVYPECVGDPVSEKIMGARANAERLLAGDSLLRQYLDLISEYQKAEDKKSFLLKPRIEALNSIQSLRFMSRMAARHQIPSAVLFFLATIRERSGYFKSFSVADALLEEKVLCEFKQCQGALDVLMTANVHALTAHETKMLVAGIEKAAMKTSLTQDQTGFTDFWRQKGRDLDGAEDNGPLKECPAE